jgi:hypothetical protein
MAQNYFSEKVLGALPDSVPCHEVNDVKLRLELNGVNAEKSFMEL